MERGEEIPLEASPAVTRSASNADFEHLIYDVLELSPESKLAQALIQDRCTTIDDLCTVTDVEVMELSFEDELVPKNERKKLLHLLWWRDDKASLLQDGVVSRDDWRSLTHDEYEIFRRGKAVARARGAPAASSSTVVDQSNTTQTTLANFRHGHKRLTGNYQEFNGSITQWRKVVRSWRSNANVDGIGRILDEHMTVPAKGSVDEQLFKEQNTWFYNMLTQRVKGGQALIIVRKHEEKRNGRAAFREMFAYYERDSNMVAIRTQCQRTLANLRLTKDYPGGPSKFFEKFQSVYLDLEQATQEAVSDSEKIGNLLAAIEDPRFFTTRDTLRNMALQMDVEVSYDRYLLAFLTHADELADEKKQAYTSSAKGKKGDGKKGWRGEKSRKGKKGKKGGDKSTYIPKDEWYALSAEERKKIIASRPKKQSAEAKRATSAKAEDSTSSEEVARATANVVTASNSPTETEGATLREIFRSQMQSYTAVAGVGKSSRASTMMLIDSGCNCGLAGRNMRLIEKYPGKFMDIEGVGSELKGRQMGSYVTRVSTLDHGDNVTCMEPTLTTSLSDMEAGSVSRRKMG